MAYRNSVQLFINGRQQTASLVMPVTMGEFLDEQLDEMTVSLRYSRRDNFPPLSRAEIVINNELYWSNRGDGNTKRKTYYFVVSDDSATETPTHSNRYNHELYLLEATKVTERCVVDTVTYTNDLGRNYTENAGVAEPVWE